MNCTASNSFTENGVVQMANTARNRLVNAIIFFADNTKFCGKIKLFKLLYLLDFEHFRQTGKSVTGGDYQAWKFGPVPIDLMEEWEELNDDLAGLVSIIPEQVLDYTRQKVVVKDGVSFDEEEFTPRQLRIMNNLVSRYKETLSPKMIDVTHEQNGAWDKIWSDGKGAHKPIPYELSIKEDAPEREDLLAIASENAMYQAALAAARQESA